VVANFAKHHRRPFSAIEGIEWPFLTLFFVLSGAELHVHALAHVGVIGAAYIGLRALGQTLGTCLGAWLSGVRSKTGLWIGLALLPQAGVAIGMALLAVQRFPELKDIIFELIGPVLTRMVLLRVGDIAQRDDTR
jgi:Kef-type K+ transport system membrane component KefB